MAVALSGSIVLAGSITGSLLGTSSYSSNAELLDGLDSSVFALTSSLSAFSSSLNGFTASINTYTASNNSSISNLNGATSSLFAATSSLFAATSSLFTYTASATLRINALDQYTASLNTRSASFACVNATNTFACAQYFSSVSNAVGFSSTGSLYSDGGMRLTKDLYVSGTSFFNNVTVFGTQSVNYITSSQLNISSNIISVNTATPSVRFGGLAVYDSGSLGTGLTGSLLWDSQDNQWIYSNPSGSEYDSAMFLVGPRSTGPLGNEAGITCNFLLKGNGMHHMTSSGIFEGGNSTCFYGTSFISASGNACFSGQVCSNTVSTTDGTNVSQLANNYLRSTAGNFYFDACSVGASFNFRTSNASALDNTALFICGTNSRVGIGTTSPSDKLHVAGAIFTTSNTILETTTGAIFDYNDSQNAGRMLAYKSTGANLLFYTNASGGGLTERMRITSTGIACFACQVCTPSMDIMPSGVGVNTTGGILKVVTTGTSTAIGVGQSNSNRYTHFAANDIQVFNDDFFLSTRCAFPLSIGTCYTARLTFAATGIACFACQVCAPSFRTSGNVEVISTSAYVLVGEGVGVNEYGVMDWDATNNRLRIATQPYAFGASGGQITLTTGGNVGIGTTSPVSALDVNGRISLGGALFTNVAQTETGAGTLASGYNLNLNNGSPVHQATGAMSGVWYDTAGVRFYTNSSQTSNTAACERMRINSSGNVLINCSRSEYGQLQVSTVPSTANTYASALGLGFLANACEGASTGISFYTKISLGAGIWENARISTFTEAVSSSAYGALAFYTMNATTLCERMRIGNNGYIGIGTTSPDERFVVAESTNPSQISLKQLTNFNGGLIGQLNFIGGGTTAKSAMIESCRVGGSATNAFRGGDLRFYTKVDDTFDCLVERVRITSAGKVGIGTTDLSTEANLYLGAQGTQEGGQLVLQKATSFQCATHIDNYNNCMRILSGTDTATTTVNMAINHANGNACFQGRIFAPFASIQQVNGDGTRTFFNQLNVAQNVPNLGANVGIIVVRDHVVGGTGAWILDPNLGVVSLGSTIPNTISFSYSSGTGSWLWCIASGSLNRCLSYGFYGA